eukprot:1275894-Rhodomonas_salina.3
MPTGCVHDQQRVLLASREPEEHAQRLPIVSRGEQQPGRRHGTALELCTCLGRAGKDGIELTAPNSNVELHYPHRQRSIEIA